jgi:hypothetical protein
MAISAVKDAWKKGTGVPVDPDPPGPGGGLYTVVGTQIKDPSGATFYPFGANTAVKMTRYNYAFEWEPGSTDTISGFSPPGEPGLFLPHIREASTLSRGTTRRAARRLVVTRLPSWTN